MAEQEPQQRLLPQIGEYIEVDEQRGPFHVVGRRIIDSRYGQQWILDDVINEDGTRGVRKWDNFPNEAVLTFAMDRIAPDGNICLMTEYTYGTDKESTESPGGIIDRDRIINDETTPETPEEAAVRKIREEIGVEIKQDTLVRLGPPDGYGEVTSRVNNRSHAFLAKVESVGEPNPNAGDNIKRKIMPFNEAMKLVKSGEIYTGVIAACLWEINDIVNNPQTNQ